ncbi:MAG: stage II sporulation protein M [Candidatus Aenigmarchaeota archaeon]|nr:stage II sporulation protein M [Candidatus Aenigmarchaeota archaeon]
MVLENLAGFEGLRQHWRRIFVFGFFVNTVSLVVASVIFEPASGLVSLFLVSAVAFPLVNKMFESEENLDVSGGEGFFQRHAEILKIYSAFFFGVLLSTAIAYFAMDTAHANNTFNFQLSALKNSAISDRATGATFSTSTFNAVLANNIKVAVVSFLLSIIFGAAAVFIITWNASVIAVFIGILTKAAATPFIGFGILAAPLAFLYGFITAVGSIALHGTPEIMSYFVAALAGGIISVGLEREKISSPRFRKVAKDGITLFALAILLIFIAASIEAY